MSNNFNFFLASGDFDYLQITFVNSTTSVLFSIPPIRHPDSFFFFFFFFVVVVKITMKKSKTSTKKRKKMPSKQTVNLLLNLCGVKFLELTHMSLASP